MDKDQGNSDRSRRNLQVLKSKENNKWFNIKCHGAIRERNLCRITMLRNTQENIQDYHNARSQANKILR